ncbi:hypothetical protein [Streptomyces sp. ISL-36]|uniref:hypothetical protein n=1 Tax=Streptomyces sp. ISL-36 TaxID=2819182 RepID=UPI0020357D0D|nr:hypothetical protein [Streptomyces sp. ISL-36]
MSAFELAVMDEAHRIAGRADKRWAIVKNAQWLRAEPRLYATATPRIFAARRLAESADLTRPRRRAPEPELGVDAFANSMDNEAVYGKEGFEYPLAQAVADGRAADYRTLQHAGIDPRPGPLPRPTAPPREGSGRFLITP